MVVAYDFSVRVVKLVVNSKQCKQWIGRKGARFARHTTRLDRHELYECIGIFAKRLPVIVKIRRIRVNEENLVNAKYHIMTNEVAIYHKDFVIFMRRDSVKDNFL